MRSPILTAKPVSLILTAILLSFMPLHADSYRESLRRYLQLNNATSPQQFEQQLRPVVGKAYPDNPDQALQALAQYSATQLPDDLLDIFEPAFRKHVSEDELQLLIQAASYPNYEALSARVADVLSSFQTSQEFQDFINALTTAVDDITSGRKPKNFKLPGNISAEYMTAFREYYTASKTDQLIINAFGTLRQTLTDALTAANVPNADKIVTRTMDYIATNFPNVMAMIFHKVTNEDDLRLLMQIASSPANQHAADAVADVLAYNQVVMASELISRMTAWMDTHAPQFAQPFHEVSAAVQQAAYPYVGEVHAMADKQPEFKGGAEAMYQYITQNMVIPEEVANSGIKGRAVYQFVVNKNGAISDVQVMRSCGDESLDNEAKRVILSMPYWTPAEHLGEVVRCKYTVPLNFKFTAPAEAPDN